MESSDVEISQPKKRTVPCRDCRGPVSPEAARCPNCGATWPDSSIAPGLGTVKRAIRKQTAYRGVRIATSFILWLSIIGAVVVCVGSIFEPEWRQSLLDVVVSLVACFLMTSSIQAVLDMVDSSLLRATKDIPRHDWNS